MPAHESADRFNLSRFVEAQRPVYDQALDEVRRGRKRSHWMWFVFPQIAGLGSSPTAEFYAISGLDEARAYLAHAVLGARLRECADALLLVSGRSASDIFPYPDDLKLRSSMTLFSLVAPRDSPFARVLEQYFDGQPDDRTLEMVRGAD
jgi:uncharacterized protein (DUF1810 family)